MSTALSFAQVVVDCNDARRLGDFYSQLLDRPLAGDPNEYFAFIPATAEPSFPGLMFLKVPEQRTGKNRVHIDLVADDRDVAVARAVTLGATHIGDFDEYGGVWTTLADPEGNVFDIAVHQPDSNEHSS